MKDKSMFKTVAAVEKERESYTLLNGKKYLNLIELNKLII